MVDLGVIQPLEAVGTDAHHVSSQVIVEWRALTIALMDRLLLKTADILGTGASLQLPHLLQGGTWSAGRAIARKLRPPDGPPPIAVVIDGSVF